MYFVKETPSHKGISTEIVENGENLKLMHVLPSTSTLAVDQLYFYYITKKSNSIFEITYYPYTMTDDGEVTLDKKNKKSLTLSFVDNNNAKVSGCDKISALHKISNSSAKNIFGFTD
jgi:hypothetical protein